MKNCKGMNCAEYEDGYHSPECVAEHAAAVAGGEFFKLEACSENTRARRERWLENIRAAIACGLPGNLERNLNNTANEIERSIKYGGTKELRAEVSRLRAAATAAPLPPSVGGEPEVLGYVVARSIFCLELLQAEELSRGTKYEIVEAIDRAAYTTLSAQLAASQARVAELERALQFYADGEHYHFESDNWDSVSGEAENLLWHSEEPDFIEDGTMAKRALAQQVTK